MQNSSVVRQPARILSAVLVSLAAGCQPQVADTPNEIGRLSQAVQTGYLNWGFEYWTTPDLGLQATGALFVTLRNPDGSPKVIPGTSFNARATCGLTFISPRYAITAAHCVSSTDIPEPENQSFVVQSYDTRNLRTDRIPTTVRGKFPNYTHGYLQPSDGYIVTQYNQCSVVKRCSFGPYRCVGSNADVALIKCADRPAESPYVSVASSDALTGPVEMYWYHEVLDMPMLEPESSGEEADVEALDHFNHYRYLGGRDHAGKQSNYHYHPDNQLLPLHSVSWPDGTSPRRVGAQWGVVHTDLFACHGSSGSGVFQRTNGLLELLGPVSAAFSYWGPGESPLLCVDLSQARKGASITGYPLVTHSQMLQANARSDPGEGMSEWVAWFVATLPI